VVFYSLNLGGAPLLDPDEPVYGQTAREMVLTGSWLTPKLNGLLWFDKPPMYFWLAALSYKIFGISEFAARFPSAVMAALTLAVTYRWGFVAFGHIAGLAAAITLGTSFLFAFLARAAVTDMTLCFFMTLSFFMLYMAAREPAEKFKHINLFYFFSGFAVLTKGPVGIVLPLMVVAPFLVFRKNYALLRALYSYTGFAFFALSALPWYAAMLIIHKSQFFNTFIGYHNLIRFLEPEHAGTNKYWFFFPVILAGIFPHVYALGGILADVLKKLFSRAFYDTYLFGKGEGAEGEKFSLAYLSFIVCVIFGFFTISKTKLVTYIFPLFPALAIILGFYYARIFSGRFSNYAGASLCALIAGGLSYAFYKKVSGAGLMLSNPEACYDIGAVCAAIAVIAILFGVIRRHEYAFISLSAAMCVFLLSVNFYLIPQLGDKYSARGICSEISKVIKPGDRLAYFSKAPSVLFYSDRVVEHVGLLAPIRRKDSAENASAGISGENKTAAGNFARESLGKLETADMQARRKAKEEALEKFSGFRNARTYLAYNRKSYLIMLASDFEKGSDEIKVRYNTGSRSGKYIYLYN